MKQNIFSIYDVKAQVYNTPFFYPHTGQAVRSLTDLVHDEKSTINRHPQDYTLYKLGEIESESGKIVAKNEPEFICTAVECKENKKALV